jgi:hypothetical protein
MKNENLLIMENETDWKGEHLIFAETTEGQYTIENKEYEMLGHLEKVRVGRWVSWCLFLEDGCYLSASCQDEVREMTKILNAKKLKK